jgi:hypothetical protein
MWSEGDVVVRREVLNDGSVWLEYPVLVVRDEPDLLATYVARDAPFTFPPNPRMHPWRREGRTSWQGHGMLMLQRPDELHAIWHFWAGAERSFAGWYVNFQEPFRRTADGYDTQDLELDLVVHPDGTVEVKDDDLLDVRVQEGRFTQDQAHAIRAVGERIQLELAAGRRWWDPWWALWEPDPAWLATFAAT